MIELLSGELAYLYEALGEIDQNEGRGGRRSLGFFHTQEEATEAAKNEGVMGTPGTVRTKQVLKQKMGNNQFAYWEIKKLEIEDQEAIRKRALAKLTFAEKKALGL